MKPYEPNLAKKTATSFFSNYVPEQILKEITDSLKTREKSFKISDRTWKITYTLQRESKIGEENQETDVYQNDIIE